MPKKGSLKDRLRKAGIRSFDVLIHDQDQDWLIKNFKQGATVYPVNVARLCLANQRTNRSRGEVAFKRTP